jgi:ComF family protein
MFVSIINSKLSHLRRFVADVLFPVFCVECGVEGEWWCEKCRRKIKINPITQGADGPLDGLTAFFNYSEGTPLAKLIHEYKYSFARDMESLWERLLNQAQDVFPAFAPASAKGYGGHSKAMAGEAGMTVSIIPIPLHPLRQRERGFNQAEIFAKIILNKFKKCGINARLENTKFIRVRHTRQQAKLSKAEREENISGAFAWNDMMQKAPENIIIIDDVYTTGATMQECAKVLKQNGAKKVYGFALAKAI